MHMTVLSIPINHKYREFTALGDTTIHTNHADHVVQAGVYLLIYSLLASRPLLVGILFVYNCLCSLCLFLLCGNDFLSCGLFCLYNFAFLVRMPMFMVHLWLPRAHVEALGSHK